MLHVYTGLSLVALLLFFFFKKWISSYLPKRKLKQHKLGCDLFICENLCIAYTAITPKRITHILSKEYKTWYISKHMLYIPEKQRRKWTKKRYSYTFPNKKTHSHSHNFPFTKHTSCSFTHLLKKRTYIHGSIICFLTSLSFYQKTKKRKVGKYRILIPYAYLQSQILSGTYKQKK